MEQVRTRSKNNTKLKPLGLLNGLKKLFETDNGEIIEDEGLKAIFETNLKGIQTELKTDNYIETVVIDYENINKTLNRAKNLENTNSKENEIEK